MLNSKERSCIVYFPRIHLNEGQEFTFEDFELVSFKNIPNIDAYLSDELIKQNGCLLKYKNNYIFGLNDNVGVFDFVEFLKFCFFSNNPPTRFSPVNNFIVNESFNPFVIINKNINPMFESKITLSNGFFGMQISRDKFIGNKIKNLEYVSLMGVLFKNYNFELYDKFKSEIYLYNQISKVNDPFTFYNKTLFSRLSIESAIKKIGLDKRHYADCFNREIDKYISLSNLKSEYLEVYEFYEQNISKNLIIIYEKINDYLKSISKIRHELAHEGTEDREEKYLVFFAIWFELFLELCSSDKPKTSYAVRLVFFLWIMHFDLSNWDKPEKDLMKIKKTYLFQYDEILRLYRSYKVNGLLEMYLQVMNNQLKALDLK